MLGPMWGTSFNEILRNEIRKEAILESELSLQELREMQASYSFY